MGGAGLVRPQWKRTRGFGWLRGGSCLVAVCRVSDDGDRGALPAPLVLAASADFRLRLRGGRPPCRCCAPNGGRNPAACRHPRGVLAVAGGRLLRRVVFRDPCPDLERRAGGTQTIAEHRMYLPLAAVITVAVCAGWAALQGVGRRRRAAIGGYLALLLAAAVALA